MTKLSVAPWVWATSSSNTSEIPHLTLNETCSEVYSDKYSVYQFLFFSLLIRTTTYHQFILPHFFQTIASKNVAFGKTTLAVFPWTDRAITNHIDKLDWILMIRRHTSDKCTLHMVGNGLVGLLSGSLVNGNRKFCFQRTGSGIKYSDDEWKVVTGLPKMITSKSHFKHHVPCLENKQPLSALLKHPVSTNCSLLTPEVLSDCNHVATGIFQ